MAARESFRASRWRAALVLVAGALAGVSAVGLFARCSGDDGRADAGDAAPDQRVKRDSGRDVQSVLDAGTDVPDADPCAVTSDWPGFRRLTEFDPCAPADVLVDPDAAYKMAWTDCDAGILGCKQLVQLVPQQFTYAYATHDDAGSGSALYLDQGMDDTSTIRQFDILNLSTSARLGEWRIDIVPANGAEIILANTTDFTTAFLGWRSSYMFASLAPAPTLFAANPIPLRTYKAPNQVIQEAISEQVMAFRPFQAPFTICQVEAGTCVPMNIASISPAVPYLTFAWHDAVFAIAEHGTTGWAQEYVIHADGSITLLRSNPNAHIWGMTTDGTTLVWEETYGTVLFQDPQTTTEVWKAPFTTDKATLDATAKKVTTLPSAGLGGAGISELDFFNGLYATYLKYAVWPPPYNVVYVVDVNTGQTQAVPRGPGGIMLGVPYVDRKELWEVTSDITGRDYLVRIPFTQPWN